MFGSKEKIGKPKVSGRLLAIAVVFAVFAALRFLQIRQMLSQLLLAPTGQRFHIHRWRLPQTLVWMGTPLICWRMLIWQRRLAWKGQLRFWETVTVWPWKTPARVPLSTFLPTQNWTWVSLMILTKAAWFLTGRTVWMRRARWYMLQPVVPWTCMTA